MGRLLSLLVIAVLVAGVLLSTAEARGELEAIRRVLVGADEVRVRIAQVPKLVRIGDEGAAALLGWLAEHDPALWVRVAAVRGLGEMKHERATAVLVDRVQHGGPWALRRALHASLARKEKAPRRLLRVLDDETRPLPARVLVLHALARQRDESSRERLLYYTVQTDSALRGAALRALARRVDDPTARTAFFARRLAETRDLEYLRELLDVLEPALHSTLVPMLRRLEGHEAADIADRARALRKAMGRASAVGPARPRAAAPDPGERYAKQDPPTPPTDPLPPTPPADPGRQDLVFVFDATGSASALVSRVHQHALGDIRDRQARGVSIRVGVVVYRGGHGRGARRRGVEVLPLTFDVERALAFIAETDTRGADDRGAAMAAGLTESLDRMAWRWRASRSVQLFADGGCDDLRATLPRVKMHYDADRTRTAVTYFLRTRTRIPDELESIAKAGGTTRPHTLR